MAISQPALLRFLDDRASTTRNALVGAIYSGLADRIRRGDFDDPDADA